MLSNVLCSGKNLRGRGGVECLAPLQMEGLNLNEMYTDHNYENLL